MLRLSFFHAANWARRLDPQLAAFYYRLMTERGHCHTQATIAVARKLSERTWTVLTRGEPYQLRAVDGQPITRAEAKKTIKANTRSRRTSAPRPGLTARQRTEPS